MPLAVSRPPPERTLTPRWIFAAMAAAVLAPASFWFGETMSNLQARRARAHDAQPAVAANTLAASSLVAAAAEEASTFAVSTQIEPAAATIWLDHHPVASGHLEIVLQKDGHTHELRAAAEGYVPVTLMFADVAPPREIALERLPAPPPEPAEPADLVSLARAAAARAVSAHAALPSSNAAAAMTDTSLRGGPAPSTPTALAPRPRSAPPRARPRANDSAPAPLPLALPEEPRVQIIDSDAPQVQVLE